MFYEERVKKIFMENIQDVLDNYKTSDIKKKIVNHCERTGVSEEDIYKKLEQKDIVVASFFAKNPTRQSSHQNLAIEYLSSLSIIDNFKALPASGVDAICIDSDSIVKKVSEAGLTHSKSIDFYFETTVNNQLHKWYITHKYTKQSGGAQDNQFADVIKFHEMAKNNIDDTCHFISLLDGAYYQKGCKKVKEFNGTKIEFLNKYYSGLNVISMTIDDFEGFILDWKQKNIK